MSKPPFNPLSFAPAEVLVDRLPDGAMLLQSPTALDPYPRCLGDLLEHLAEVRGDRMWDPSIRPVVFDQRDDPMDWQIDLPSTELRQAAPVPRR